MLKTVYGKFTGHSIIKDEESTPAVSWRRDQEMMLGRIGFFLLEEIPLSQGRTTWVIKDYVPIDNEDVNALSLFKGS